MTSRGASVEYGVDANGCLTEELELSGGSVRLHFDDIPESDITTVDGLRVTTPLRTVIDLAADLTPAELDQMVQTCLTRRLLSVAEAYARLDQPDVASRPGARILGAPAAPVTLPQRRRAARASAGVPPVTARRRSGDDSGVAGPYGTRGVVASRVRAVGKRAAWGGDACSVT